MIKQYNFELAMGATISESVVQEMVTSIVEKQTGKKVKSIELMYDESKFSGYSVTFYTDTAPPQKSFKPSREFIAETYGADE
jgi:hypothetical protein